MFIIPGKKKLLAPRYYANLIDYSIVFFVSWVFTYTLGTESDGTYELKGAKALLIPLMWTIYFPVCESLTGQTLGKKALRLSVVNFRGEKLDIFNAFVRRIFDVFELSFLGIPALLSINYSDKNQRLGDMVAKSTVIRAEAICRHCSEKVELTPHEFLDNKFTCPFCHQPN